MSLMVMTKGFILIIFRLFMKAASMPDGLAEEIDDWKVNPRVDFYFKCDFNEARYVEI